MLSRDQRFVRVKAGGAGLGGRTTYWLGPDHLLVVTATYFAESYRRFYYAEIGAVVVRRTTARGWLIMVAGVCLVLLGLWAVSIGGLSLNTSWAEDEMAGAVMLGILVVLGLGVFAAEWFGGPTCTCRVQTAVQVSVLPGVRRWRKAELLLEMLAPRIAAAQRAGGDTSQVVDNVPGLSSQPAAEGISSGSSDPRIEDQGHP